MKKKRLREFVEIEKIEEEIVDKDYKSKISRMLPKFTTEEFSLFDGIENNFKLSSKVENFVGRNCENLKKQEQDIMCVKVMTWELEW